MTLEGSLLGRYRLRRRLGTGGMAEVWEAVDESFQRPVAIKVVHEDIADEDEFHRRFLREARLAAKLEHPHILSVTDYGSEAGTTWLAMPIRDGGTLSDRLRGGADPASCLSWLRALASALDYAHARGVIHRDVKPANVLFDGDGNLYLADFGLARGINSGTRVTMDGSTVGTPSYMSPEQATGRSLDGRTDQYSLAILAFRMLTGHLPVEDCPTPILLQRRAYEDSPAPSSRDPRLGRDVDRVFARGLSREPSSRFDSCLDFVTALQRALQLAPPAGWSEPGESRTVTLPHRAVARERGTPPPLPRSPAAAAAAAVEAAEAEAEADAGGDAAVPATTRGPELPDPPSFGTSGLRERRAARPRVRWEWIALVLGLAFLAFALLY